MLTLLLANLDALSFADGGQPRRRPACLLALVRTALQTPHDGLHGAHLRAALEGRLRHHRGLWGAARLRMATLGLPAQITCGTFYTWHRLAHDMHKA